MLDWSIAETCRLLDLSEAAVTSALQRARATLKQRLPRHRLEWSPPMPAAEEDRSLLRRYIDATERGDLTSMTNLLRADARMVMPPLAAWYDGRDAVLTAMGVGLEALAGGSMRSLQTAANRQPAVACYFRAAGETEHRALVLNVLRIEGGVITDITGFDPSILVAFGLPPTL